jgi:hypothetical protein
MPLRGAEGRPQHANRSPRSTLPNGWLAGVPTAPDSALLLNANLNGQRADQELGDAYWISPGRATIRSERSVAGFLGLATERRDLDQARHCICSHASGVVV